MLELFRKHGLLAIKAFVEDIIAAIFAGSFSKSERMVTMPVPAAMKTKLSASFLGKPKYSRGNSISFRAVSGPATKDRPGVTEGPD